MDWSDRYDQTAEQARNISRLGQDIPVLQREVEPSVEYADDVLPLFSDTAAASYRLSCIRYGLLRSGGVSLNRQTDYGGRGPWCALRNLTKYTGISGRGMRLTHLRITC